jgi:hypothetical protein
MAAPLNIFKTETGNLTTISSTIYTVPSGYTTVALLAQVSNTSNDTVGVTALHVRSTVSTTIISNVQIPVNDAVNLLTGKLILQTGDSVAIRCSANSSAQILLSILETAN